MMYKNFPEVPHGSCRLVHVVSDDITVPELGPFILTDSVLLAGANNHPYSISENGEIVYHLPQIGPAKRGGSVDKLIRAAEIGDPNDRGLWHMRPFELPPNQRYFAIWRPYIEFRVHQIFGRQGEENKQYPYCVMSEQRDDVPDEVYRSLLQIESLNFRFTQICNYVHPEIKNWKVYGPEIRNLFLLASMEVESQFRRVLRLNGLPGNSERYTTNDFVKLLAPMKLAEYSVSFQQYPWVPALWPFKGWRVDDPTKTLEWYDAYHGVKHDREKNLEAANVMNAAYALSACVILLAAQIGPNSVGVGGFLLSDQPRWSFSELYWEKDGVMEHVKLFAGR